MALLIITSSLSSDVPTVSISSVTSEVLEDGVGSLSLSCEVEANPAVTSVMWLSVDTGEVVR